MPRRDPHEQLANVRPHLRLEERVRGFRHRHELADRNGSSPSPHAEPVQRHSEEVARGVVDPIDVVPPFPQAQERVLRELLRVLAVAGDEVEGFEQALAFFLEERVETGPCLDQLERDAHGVFLCSHATWMREGHVLLRSG